MSWKRRFFYCFWALVGVLLCWNTYQCHEARVAHDHQNQVPEHMFFYHSSNAHAKVAAPVQKAGPDVQQTNFEVDDNTPSTAAFTCLITVTNKGTVKAVNVQVQVSPYKGVTGGDEDVGRVLKPNNTTNPLAQISQWVTFPDLDPGKTATQSAVFMKQGNLHAGKNPSPQIIFEAAKK